MGWTNYLAFAIVLLSFVVGIAFYNQMPDRMAAHWNSQGVVDDYFSKFWGLFLMPFVSLALFLLLTFIPKLDPLKENIAKFKKYYERFILVLILFMFYIYILTLLWSLNITFNANMIQLISPAFAVLFFYAGVLISHSKRNWFIGIRTPWTLSSEVSWNKTHALGSKFFKISGILSLLGIFFPSIAIWFVLLPILLSVIIVFVYSYVVYKKDKKK